MLYSSGCFNNLYENDVTEMEEQLRLMQEQMRIMQEKLKQKKRKENSDPVT